MHCVGIIMEMKCTDEKVGKLYFYKLVESGAGLLCRFRWKVKGTRVWGVLLLCPRWSSRCRRRPSCAFESSTLHKGYSPQLAWEQEKRACLFLKNLDRVHLFFWKRGCGKEHSSMQLVMLCCSGIKITSCEMTYSTYLALMQNDIQARWRKEKVVPISEQLKVYVCFPCGKTMTVHVTLY